MLELEPDELLTTTRSARKRLDFDRPVPRQLIRECLEIAFQAPNGSNINSWRWVVVDDPKLVAAAAEIYNGGLDDFIASLGGATGESYMGASVPGAERIATSVQHLRDNFHRCPALLVPLLAGSLRELERLLPGQSMGLDHPGGLELLPRAAHVELRRVLEQDLALRLARFGFPSAASIFSRTLS